MRSTDLILIYVVLAVVLCCYQFSRIHEITVSPAPPREYDVLITTTTRTRTATRTNETLVRSDANNNHRGKLQPAQQRPHVLFYNIFVPNVTTNTRSEETAFIDLIEKLLHEQLNQTNGYLSANEAISVGRIKYLLIDSSTGAWFDEARIQGICSQYKHLECEMMGDKPLRRGNEYMTLAKVHEYCKATEDKSQRVSYFHSKGTLHPNTYNEVWRYFLLKAMLHPDCLDPPPSLLHGNNNTMGGQQQNCDACGLQFHPIWNTFFPGNFWTAQCSMTQQLLDPVQYEKELRSIIPKMYNSKQFESNLYPWGPPWGTWTLGFGRMAAEFWVGSHPDLQPCDLSQEALVFSWCRSLNFTANFSFHYGVRHDYHTQRHMIKRSTFHLAVQNEKLRKREYYWLPGLLVRWYALYQKFPPQDSWVWRHYPDGQYWQQRVQDPAYLLDFYASIQNQSTHVKEWDEALAEVVLQHDDENLWWLDVIKKYLNKNSSFQKQRTPLRQMLVQNSSFHKQRKHHEQMSVG